MVHPARFEQMAPFSAGDYDVSTGDVGSWRLLPSGGGERKRDGDPAVDVASKFPRGSMSGMAS
jgi:hypothetical protein